MIDDRKTELDALAVALAEEVGLPLQMRGAGQGKPLGHGRKHSQSGYSRDLNIFMSAPMGRTVSPFGACPHLGRSGLLTARAGASRKGY